MRNLLLSVLAVFLFASCEKDLDIKIDSGEPNLVVQGQIESDGLPFVILTKSMGFLDNVDPSKIKFVTGAIVQVIDLTEGDTMPLKNYVIDTQINNQVYQYSVYFADTGNVTNWITGKYNHLYKLTIYSEGKTYESITKIPTTVQPDSTYLLPRTIPNTSDTVYELYVKYSDPDTSGNYTRYFTSRRSSNPEYDFQEYTQPDNGIFTDIFSNGKTNNWSLNLAIRDSVQFRNAAQFFPYIYLLKGDTATVKFCAIDYNTYNFWNTLDFSKGAVGNPFSSPTKIQGNISNDALGAWCGYGVNYFTYYAPK